MKRNNKRKGGKCQGILRKSWHWCNWDMKRMRRVRKKKKKWERRKMIKRGRNSGIGRLADDKLKWSQANEWGKLNWKKDRHIGYAGDNRRGMKSRNKRKWGKRERVKRKLRKKVKVILSIVISKKCGKTGKLNGTIPYNIDYRPMYRYINDKLWRITLIKKIFYYCKVRCWFIVGNMSPWKTGPKTVP